MPLDSTIPVDSSRSDTEAFLKKESLLKFTSDGAVRLFPGVTVVRHLTKETSLEALCKAMEKYLPKSDESLFRSSYVHLPKDSFHMTTLDTKVYVEDNSVVPDYMNIRTSTMAEFIPKFRDAMSELQHHLPIEMIVDRGPERNPENGHSLGVPLKPRNDEEAKKIRTIREVLGKLFGVKLKPGYAFHVTACYPLYKLPKDEFAALQQRWMNAVQLIADEVPVINIDGMELCTFENMFHFDIAASVYATSNNKDVGKDPMT